MNQHMLNQNPYHNDSYSRGTNGGCLGTIAFFLVAVVIMFVVSFFGGAIANTNHQTQTCTVMSKDRAINKDNHTSYRIYTKECDVMVIDDSVFLGRWDSASVYGQIEPGKVYKFETIGWRVPFLSMFPNVAKVEPQ